jgi:hypothetical protein
MTDFLSLQPPSRDPFSTGPREYLNQIMNMVTLLRNGDHRFLPLLLSKVNDVLPRLANPMLQNAPENSNLANIDIFDGFGNAGMAQPPPPQMQMSLDTNFDRKFSVSEYDKKFSISEMSSTGNDASSSNGSTGQSSMPPASAADMSSPFVSSPAIMSPGMEFPHGLSDFACTPMSDMVMNPMAHPGGINPQATQHQHHGMQTLQNQCLNSQQIQQGMGQHHNGHGTNLSGLSPQQLQNGQGMNSNPIPTSHPMGQTIGGPGSSLMGSIARQPPQRANSFAMQPNAMPRTVGDFHALQRANSDTNQGMNSLVGMSGLPTGMDYDGMR